MSAQVDYIQDSRFLKIDTELGDSALLLTGLNGTDAVSKPFCFDIEFGTRLPDAQILTLIGKPATIWFCNTPNAAPRPVNGVIRKLSGPWAYPQGFSGWRAELVPQFTFMSYTRNCRIYQNKTVMQIVTDMLNQYGIRKFEFRSLMGTYPALDYCVQYRESALDFVARLLEHFGIYYWFEHTATTHTLVLADATRVAKPASPDTLVLPDQDQNAPVQTLEASYAFRPGTWTLKDYDFVNPDSPLKSSTPTMITDAPMASYEIFDYPGTYAEASHGDNLSRVRIEQEESQFHRMRGTGTLPLLDAGTIATIALPEGATGHTDQKFFMIEVTHQATDMTHIAANSAPASYGNTFVVVPSKYGYRPERTTEKPCVQGPQTARVCGPAGQQIYTDKHARVKVRFHWDRNPDGNTDDNSSCWVRVSQSWASGMGGSIHIPRIGEEVIVDFLEGDPDQPIITGRVYNGNNMTQFALPGNQTQSGFKTQSIPSGGSHELRFEDKAGSEEIYLHSQKDFNRKIENDESDKIGGNATRNIQGTLDHTTNGAESHTINQTFTKNTTGAEDRTNQNNFTHTVAGTHMMTINGAESKMSNTSMTILSPQQIETINNMITNAPTSKTTTSPYMLTAIGANVGIYATQDSLTGQCLQIYGLNTQICATNSSIADINLTMNAVETTTIGMTLKTMGSQIHTAATAIKNGASSIENFVVKLLQ